MKLLNAWLGRNDPIIKKTIADQKGKKSIPEPCSYGRAATPCSLEQRTPGAGLPPEMRLKYAILTTHWAALLEATLERG